MTTATAGLTEWTSVMSLSVGQFTTYMWGESLCPPYPLSVIEMVSPTVQELLDIYKTYFSTEVVDYMKEHPSHKPSTVRGYLHNLFNEDRDKGVRALLVKKRFDPFLKTHLGKIAEKVEAIQEGEPFMELYDRYYSLRDNLRNELVYEEQHPELKVTETIYKSYLRSINLPDKYGGRMNAAKRKELISYIEHADIDALVTQ